MVTIGIRKLSAMTVKRSAEDGGASGFLIIDSSSRHPELLVRTFGSCSVDTAPENSVQIEEPKTPLGRHSTTVIDTEEKFSRQQ